LGGKLVVGEYVRPLFGLAQVREAHRRDGMKRQKFGSFDPPVPGDDLIVVIDQPSLS
jgi:hypothetical protein